MVLPDDGDGARTPEPDERIIEVLADPVRWRTYRLLLGLGPKTAARLAPLVSIGEASMLRHLAVLESIGFVQADSGESAPRRQLWRAVPGGLRLTGHVAATDEQLMRRWLHAYAHAQNLVLREWCDTESRWGEEWREAAMNYDYWMRLTVDELHQMVAELHEVSERWNKKSQERDAPADSEVVYVGLDAVPYRE